MACCIYIYTYSAYAVYIYVQYKRAIVLSKIHDQLMLQVPAVQQHSFTMDSGKQLQAEENATAGHTANSGLSIPDSLKT